MNDDDCYWYVLRTVVRSRNQNPSVMMMMEAATTGAGGHCFLCTPSPCRHLPHMCPYRHRCTLLAVDATVYAQ